MSYVRQEIDTGVETAFQWRIQRLTFCVIKHAFDWTCLNTTIYYIFFEKVCFARRISSGFAASIAPAWAGRTTRLRAASSARLRCFTCATVCCSKVREDTKSDIDLRVLCLCTLGNEQQSPKKAPRPVWAPTTQQESIWALVTSLYIVFVGVVIIVSVKGLFMNVSTVLKFERKKFHFFVSR